MRRLHRLLAGLCALVLAAGLFLPYLAASADEAVVYQTALNDKLLDLTSETMPVASGGAYYVPYTIFDRDVTGVSLGVSYGQLKTSTSHTLTLYTMGSMLIFDVNNNTCADGSGESKNMKAILRNGKVYVPLSGVCSFFGLSYTFTPTSYGTLIRITNGQEWLSTERFVDAAASWMKQRYQDYIKGLSGPSPSAGPSAPASPSPQQSPDQEAPDKRDVRVYLAFRYTGGQLDSILSLLDQAGVHALFFFAPEDLAANGGAIRRMVGSGHGVGLVLPAGTEEEQALALEQGSRLLERIAHLRPHTFLAEDGTAPEIPGWACWVGNVDGIPNGRSAAGLARAVLEEAGAKRSLARITLDSSDTAAAALGRILSGLRQEHYSIRLAVETEL